MSKFKEKIRAFLEEKQEEREISKSWNIANAAFKSKLALMEADILNHEYVVEKAQEELDSCKVNGGKLIKDRDEYLESLVIARNNLIEAENKLESLRETAKFFKDTHEELK